MNQETQTQSEANDTIRIHEKDGVYLVVADSSEEFCLALKYAGKTAKVSGCHVAILFVMEQQDFQHWGQIERKMRHEQREQAEKCLSEACIKLEEWGCGIPVLYIEEGGRMETLARVIEEDHRITKLVLGGGTHGGGPGPLVAHFSGKGLMRLRVPLVVVPDHLKL